MFQHKKETIFLTGASEAAKEADEGLQLGCPASCYGRSGAASGDPGRTRPRRIRSGETAEAAGDGRGDCSGPVVDSRAER